MKIKRHFTDIKRAKKFEKMAKKEYKTVRFEEEVWWRSGVKRTEYNVICEK